MYKVTCLYQGTTYTLHDPDSEILRLYDDQVQTEDSKPGSFKFSISYDHPYLDKIVGLSSDIRVYDGDDEIFRGRPTDDGEDLYRERTFECEGELAFLYDSIQPRRELHSVTPLEFFTLLVNEHNAQVKGKGGIDKTFQVGVVTVTDSNNSLYRYTNRETTYECITDKIIDRLGGHLSVRVENGVRYLDLLADVDTVSDQPIQLGENLMNYAKDTDYTQVATACIPLGAALEETEIEALDAYLTVADVNSGSDVIRITEAVNRYGFICKVVNFDDITVPANLLTAGNKWLTDGQYANMTLTLTAVDLHGLGYDVSAIRVNSKVRVVSKPHGMDRYFEVTKRTYHLTKPESDTVQFGTTLKEKSFTSSSHSKVSSVSNHAEQVRKNIDSVIAAERENVSNILNQATHGYVVLDPNDGPERILIMDTNSVDTAQKIWKWDMNGLGYSKSGINGPWGVAITMNGEISADYILTGELDASLIKAGIIQDVKGLNSWNMETGELTLNAYDTSKEVSSKIKALADSISLSVTNGKLGSTATIKLSANGETDSGTIDMSGVRNAFRDDHTAISISAGTVTFNSNTFVVNSTYFSVTSTGVITATSGEIGGFSIKSSYLYSGKTSLTSDTYGVYVGTDGVSVGSGSAFTALADGYLRGGKSSSITGYVGFNNYWSPTGVYGTRLAGRGCIALLTNGAFGIGSYYGFDSEATITTGCSGSITVVTDISNNWTPASGKAEWNYATITFTKGLMTTSL